MFYLEIDKTASRGIPQGQTKTFAKRYPLCTPYCPPKFGLVTPEVEKPLSFLSRGSPSLGAPAFELCFRRPLHTVAFPAHKKRACAVRVYFFPVRKRLKHDSKGLVMQKQTGLDTVLVKQGQRAGLEVRKCVLVLEYAGALVDFGSAVNEHLMLRAPRPQKVSAEFVAVVHGAGNGMSVQITDRLHRKVAFHDARVIASRGEIPHQRSQNAQDHDGVQSVYFLGPVIPGHPARQDGHNKWSEKSHEK